MFYKICISLWVATCLRFSQAQIRQSFFRQYDNFVLDGCQVTESSRSHMTDVSSAVQCSQDTTCSAFKLISDSSTLVTCAGSETQELFFPSDTSIMLLRNVIVTEVSLDISSDFYYRQILSSAPTTGAIMYVFFKYFSTRHIEIHLGHKGGDIHFILYAFYDVSTEQYIITTSYKMNGIYGPEKLYSMTEFPFVKNRDAKVYILVRQDKFIIYIDGVLCCEADHVLSLQTVNYMSLHGSMYLYELSM